MVHWYLLPSHLKSSIGHGYGVEQKFIAVGKVELSFVGGIARVDKEGQLIN